MANENTSGLQSGYGPFPLFDPAEVVANMPDQTTTQPQNMADAAQPTAPEVHEENTAPQQNTTQNGTEDADKDKSEKEGGKQELAKPKVDMPDAVQVIDDPDADYYVAVGLFDNFNGMSKANFISEADIRTNEMDDLADYKMQDLFYGAYHFEDLSPAVEIATKYYQYYGTKSQLYAVYGVKDDKPTLIWYQDGFYSYIGKSQIAHGDNWFYGIVDFPKVKEDFSKEDAPILLRGRSLNDQLLPSLGGFPRELVVAQYDIVHNSEPTVYMYYYEDPHAFDTAMSRLARLEARALENAYNLEDIKKAIFKQRSILSRATSVVELTDYAKNEKQVPGWLRSLARYGRND